MITVQAGAYTATGTSFPIILNIPADGVYTITARVEDNCGNVGLDTIANVRVDTTDPVVGISSPLTGECINSTVVVVNGSITEDGSGVAVITVQAGAYTATGTSFPIILNIPADGVYTITARVEDNCGNIGLDTVTNVRVDTTAPVVGISSPLTGECITTSTVEVDGTVTEDGSGVAMITVQAGAYSATGTSFPITLNIPADGVYTITAWAEDNCGNIGLDTADNVRVDTEAPTGLGATPAGGSYCATPVSVTLNTSDGTIYYTLDGSGPDTGSSSYTVPIDISEDTTLKFMAVDSCGNQASTVTEVYDIDEEISMSITSPVDGITLYAGDVTVSGTADTDITTVIVTSDQGHSESPRVAGGNWSVILSGVTLPSLNINAAVTDDCGNTTSNAVSVTVSEPTIWYVNDNAAGNNDGTSWADAFTVIQDAVDTASTDNWIWVAEGTYTNAPTTILSVLTMKAGVEIYGGFTGTESDLSERNPATNKTILDGEDTSYNVVKGNSNARLDGFTVTNGNASYLEPWQPAKFTGGGMYNESVSDLMVANCTFSGNSAEFGGGMCNNQSSPTIINCTFIGNSVNDTGGGLFNYVGSSPTITNCIFIGNSASSSTGGIVNQYSDSSPTITNCTFIGNSAPSGGCISDWWGDPSCIPTITNCIMWGNSPDEITGLATVTYSDIAGGWTGTGNIGALPVHNPLFVLGPNGDYYLSQPPGQGTTSPCVDTGSNTAANLGLGNKTTSTNGDLDIGTVDMGYHYEQ